MKLAIIGSRSLDNFFDLITEHISENITIDITEIVSGGAKGVDRIAKAFAKNNNLLYKEFLPQYNGKNDKYAPLIRNSEIAKYADSCLAIVDNSLETSKGTFDCVKKFKKLNKIVTIIIISTRM